MVNVGRLLFTRKRALPLFISALSFVFGWGFSMSALSLDVSAKEPTFSLAQNDCQFSGSFEQIKQIDGIDQALKSNGVFYHHCEQGVIWSTTEPVVETLIMRRDGKGFVITANEQEQLKSRQGKFLSSLLNSLMSGDQAAIEKQFKLKLGDNNTVTLTPTKRSLKRAIKFIEVQRSVDLKRVDITIVDRNAQKTHINSTQTSVFNPLSSTDSMTAKTDNIIENCQLALNTKLEPTQNSCAQLLADNGRPSKKNSQEN